MIELICNDASGLTVDTNSPDGLAQGSFFCIRCSTCNAGRGGGAGSNGAACINTAVLEIVGERERESILTRDRFIIA